MLKMSLMRVKEQLRVQLAVILVVDSHIVRFVCVFSLTLSFSTQSFIQIHAHAYTFKDRV